MTLQVKLILALILALGVGGLYVWGREGHVSAQEAHQKVKEVEGERDAAKDALRLYKSAQAANVQLSVKRDNVAKTQRAANEARSKDLHDALQGNRGWADQPVPDSVWDSIGPQAARPNQAAPARGADVRVPGTAAPAR